ncbi:tRNA synthetases class I (C) catalytic domain protein [Mycobacterium xenopi 4042]|uniref:tRNA synthetases class I (C) catalytic domain protein n=1 Tax=Mycobacterium xenopi 4042 TaxID=1299334 RepID=X8BE06_MYCXE|nr:tRNA synthetases class I (C) catalytic domain protein [Mycobacterium xenopi 4042]
MHRLWLDLGHQVRYVQNVTDVDDPLFERADRDGVDWRELAAREVDLFRDDMAALRVLPPQQYVSATEAIAEVVELVEKMLASGAAYTVDDGYPDVYYRPTPHCNSATNPAMTATPCCGCSPSAAATRAVKARATSSTR